jgi:hypothetical protein
VAVRSVAAAGLEFSLDDAKVRHELREIATVIAVTVGLAIGSEIPADAGEIMIY